MVPDPAAVIRFPKATTPLAYAPSPHWNLPLSGATAKAVWIAVVACTAVVPEPIWIVK